jgi:hypothetical protein
MSLLPNISISASSTVENKEIIAKGFIILSITLVISGLSVWGSLAQVIPNDVIESQLTHEHHNLEISVPIHYLYDTIILGLLVIFTWFLFRNSFLKEMKLVLIFIVVALISQSWDLIVNDPVGIEHYFNHANSCESCPDRLENNTYLDQSNLVIDLVVFQSLIIGYIIYFCQSSPHKRYNARSRRNNLFYPSRRLVSCLSSV